MNTLKVHNEIAYIDEEGSQSSDEDDDNVRP